MAKAVFFDIREKEAVIHVLEKEGDGYRPVEAFSATLGEGYSFDAGRRFEDFEEAGLSVPLTLLNFRLLELPFEDMDKIMGVLPFELDGLIMGGSSGAVFDAVILEKLPDGKSKVLVAYAEKELLKTMVSRVKAFGADPRSITSLELSSILRGHPASDIAGLLIEPPALAEDSRAGLAANEMASPAINLRTGELAFTKDAEQVKRSLRFTIALAALVLLVFVSDMGFRIVMAKKQQKAIKDEIRKIYSGVFPAEKKITDEVYQMKAHMREIKEKEQTYMGVSPLKLLLDLSAITRAGTSFSEVTVGAEGIVLKGECPALSDVESIKASLEKLLIDVSISDAKPASSGRTAFTMTAKGRKP